MGRGGTGWDGGWDGVHTPGSKSGHCPLAPGLTPTLKADSCASMARLLMRLIYVISTKEETAVALTQAGFSFQCFLNGTAIAPATPAKTQTHCPLARENQL